MRLADPAERVAARADVDAPELELEQRVHPQVLARAPVLQHDARAVQAGRGERDEVLRDHVRRCGGGWRGWVGAAVHARRCARAPLCDAQEPRGVGGCARWAGRSVGPAWLTGHAEGLLQVLLEREAGTLTERERAAPSGRAGRSEWRAAVGARHRAREAAGESQHEGALVAV